MKKNRSVVTAGCKNAVTINRSVVTMSSKSAVTINCYCQTTKFCSLLLVHKQLHLVVWHKDDRNCCVCSKPGQRKRTNFNCDTCDTYIHPKKLFLTIPFKRSMTSVYC